MILIEQLIQVLSSLVLIHLIFVLRLQVEGEASLTLHSFTLVLVLSGFFALLAPVFDVASCMILRALLITACVDTLCHINQTYFALDASHVRLGDQFISMIRWSLP